MPSSHPPKPGLEPLSVQFELLSFTPFRVSTVTSVFWWPDEEGARAARHIAALHRQKGLPGDADAKDTSCSRRVEQVLRFYFEYRLFNALAQVTHRRICRCKVSPQAEGETALGDDASYHIQTPLPIKKMMAIHESEKFTNDIKVLSSRQPYVSYTQLECFLICATINIQLICQRPTDSDAEDVSWLHFFIQTEKKRSQPDEAQLVVTKEQYYSQRLHAKRIVNFVVYQDGRYRVSPTLSLFRKFLRFQQHMLSIMKAVCEKIAAGLKEAVPGLQLCPQFCRDLLEQM